MGVCNTCHGDAGWLSHECSNCRAKREAVEAAQAAAERQAAELERQAQIDSMVEAAIVDLKAKTDAGGTVHLVDCLVLPLDENGWLDHAGLDRLREFGERGWQVLLNTRQIVLDQGLDGTAHGLHVPNTQMLVSLSVTAASIQQYDAEIRSYYAARATEALDTEG